MFEYYADFEKKKTKKEKEKEKNKSNQECLDKIYTILINLKEKENHASPLVRLNILYKKKTNHREIKLHSQNTVSERKLFCFKIKPIFFFILDFNLTAKNVLVRKSFIRKLYIKIFR